MDFNNFLDLKSNLKQIELPGDKAHLLIAPPGRFKKIKAQKKWGLSPSFEVSKFIRTEGRLSRLSQLPLRRVAHLMTYLKVQQQVFHHLDPFSQFSTHLKC